MTDRPAEDRLVDSRLRNWNAVVNGYPLIWWARRGYAGFWCAYTFDVHDQPLSPKSSVGER
jgi:hypothetical protein